MLSHFRWLLLTCGLTLLATAGASGQEANPSTGPLWLAVDGFAGGDTLWRSVTTAAVESARLKIAGDYCRLHVAINGRSIAVIEPYCQTQTFDVTDAFRPGENRIEIAARPIAAAPAVVAATLSILQADGLGCSISTDEQWQVTAANGAAGAAKSRGLVPPEMWGLGRRDISIDPFENYEQWQQAKGGGGAAPRFFVAHGFEIAQLRVAQPDEGSWISLASDERGRLTIAREDQGFLRLSLSEDGKTVTQVQPIASDLQECRGLAYREGWLYASANNSKKLFRLQLGEGGDSTNLTLLRELSGGVGHGRNDLSVFGGRLYLICGDSVDSSVAEMVDHLSPRRRQVAGSFTKEGSLLRTSFAGDRWEILCAGLRNPYGIAHHPDHGDAFTYDADNEYDLGMPWYRPTRVLHLLPGGDYGYREATGQIPPRFSDQPDNAPPLIDIGRGSPTAVISGREFNFPRPYRDALFALDWTYGRVLAVHLAPRGAGYRAATELFLQGKPLNVTDVAAGRDGAMYLITGGRKTQSALYRVTAIPPPILATTAAPHAEVSLQTAVDEHALHSRQLARQFQSPDEEATGLEVGSMLPYLDDPDPVLRYAALTALERHPDSAWLQTVLQSPVENASPRGLMAAARFLDASRAAAIVERLVTLSPAKMPVDRRLVSLRVIELCLRANRQAVLDQGEAIERMLVTGWQAGDSPLWQVSVEGTNADYRRRAALLLHEVDSPRLPELAAGDLLASAIQEDQIAGLMALRDHRPGWTPAFRELQLQALAAMPGMAGGEGLPNFHAWLERETLASLPPVEQTGYAALKAALAEPEPLPPTRPVVQKWRLDELKALAGNAETGDAERGKTVFQAALCARCHRFGQRGSFIGPELTFVAGRFSPVDILDSILNPSKAVAENYRAEVVQTTDGQIVTGRLAPGGDFRSEKIRLVPNLLRLDQVIELDKKSIESHEQSVRSPMPEGLLDTFSRDEIVDLMAYLTGGKQAYLRGR